MNTDISACFIVWIVTTQCVNFAFYLSITRVAHGWLRTVAAYFVYFAMLAIVFPLTPLAHGGAHGTAGTLSLTFISFFTLWGTLAMAMSRGVPGRRVLAVLLCGAYQLIAFSASLLIIRYAKSEVVGPLLASAAMALMGWFLVACLHPRIERMPDSSEWTYLNVMAAALFVLLYAAGIWPIFVATGSFEHVLIFSIAAIVAVVFYPTAMTFAEKSRQASSLATVEDNLRLMAGQLESRREIIAVARQICNDRRARCGTLADLLQHGKVDEALAYLKRLGDEAKDLQPEESSWCENETVNAILSGYSHKATAAGLHFSAMASVNDQDDLPEIEMVEMVSNLLEIAIRTACAKGEVTCLLRQRAGSFGVTVTNTVAPDFRLTAEGLPLSPSDSNLAGALNLARKCRGECRYHLNASRLTCDALVSFFPKKEKPRKCEVFNGGGKRS